MGAVVAVFVILVMAAPTDAFAQKRRKKRSSRKAKVVKVTKPSTSASKAARADARNKKRRKKGLKTLDFTGLDLAGRMRTPQLLYFLERASQELNAASLERRSFIPEMVRSIDEEAL